MLFLLKLNEYNLNNGIKVNGLTDPVILASLRTRDDCMRSDDFIEFVCSYNNHWVCVASGSPMYPTNVGICLFDSMARTHIDTELGTTCSLITSCDRLKKGFLRFRMQKVQQQNASLCGYYALANAIALCLGLDPGMLEFTESDLREHFIEVVYHQKPMSMFPHKKRRIRSEQIKRRYHTFELRNFMLTDREYYLT